MTKTTLPLDTHPTAERVYGSGTLSHKFQPHPEDPKHCGRYWTPDGIYDSICGYPEERHAGYVPEPTAPSPEPEKVLKPTEHAFVPMVEDPDCCEKCWCLEITHQRPEPAAPLATAKPESEVERQIIEQLKADIRQDHRASMFNPGISPEYIACYRCMPRRYPCDVILLLDKLALRDSR